MWVGRNRVAERDEKKRKGEFQGMMRGEQTRGGKTHLWDCQTNCSQKDPRDVRRREAAKGYGRPKRNRGFSSEICRIKLVQTRGNGGGQGNKIRKVPFFPSVSVKRDTVRRRHLKGQER